MELKTKSTYNLKQPKLVPVTEKELNRPDPEVLDKKPRRRFTAKYKLSILAEVDTCNKPGDIGALLRREGLYYSNIHTWQRQQQKGALKRLAKKKEGERSMKSTPWQNALPNWSEIIQSWPKSSNRRKR